MFALVFGMLVCLVGGLVVVGSVAAQARKEGRDVLTERGEEVVDRGADASRLSTAGDTAAPFDGADGGGGFGARAR